MTLKSLLDNLQRFFRRVWYNSIFYRFTLMGGTTPKHLMVIPTDPWPGDLYAGRLLLEGKFIISNQVISMTDLWMPKGVMPHALADLHRFTWLRDLRAQGDNSARRLARQLIINWIDRNQDWRLYPWQVGITGHRVANWIDLYDFFCSSADDNFRGFFFREIARQVRHLLYAWKDASTSLERFFALKGIIYAAAAFPGESHHLRTRLTQLEKEIQAQILPDGGHRSRCAKTHFIVLRDLIDIRAILRSIHYEIPSFLQTYISKMAPIVRLFRHGDGELATFGKETHIPSPVIDMLLSLADVRGRPPERAPTLGFERCANKNSLILLNVGARIPGIDCFSDLEEGTGSLNFEWSVGRDRLVVQGDMILQTQEGKPYQVSDKANPESTHLHRMRQGGHALLDATYTAVNTMPFSHRRQLYLSSDQSNLRGEDTIQVSCEAMYGIRFILDKKVEASLVSGKRGVMIYLPDHGQLTGSKKSQLWRFLTSGAEEILCESYAENQVILLLGRLSKQSISIQWAFCQD